MARILTASFYGAGFSKSAVLSIVKLNKTKQKIFKKQQPTAFSSENYILQYILENLKHGKLYRTNNLISSTNKLQGGNKREKMKPRDLEI